jgi:hypothetical protein
MLFEKGMTVAMERQILLTSHVRCDVIVRHHAGIVVIMVLTAREDVKSVHARY